MTVYINVAAGYQIQHLLTCTPSAARTVASVKRVLPRMTLSLRSPMSRPVVGQQRTASTL